MLKKFFFSDFTKVLKQKRGLNKLGFFPCYFDEYKGFYLLFERLKFFKKMGGVSQKSTWFLGGVVQKSTMVHKGGGGVKKFQKSVHMV